MTGSANADARGRAVAALAEAAGGNPGASMPSPVSTANPATTAQNRPFPANHALRMDPPLASSVSFPNCTPATAGKLRKHSDYDQVIHLYPGVQGGRMALLI